MYSLSQIAKFIGISLLTAGTCFSTYQGYTFFQWKNANDKLFQVVAFDVQSRLPEISGKYEQFVAAQQQQSAPVVTSTTLPAKK